MRAIGAFLLLCNALWQATDAFVTKLDNENVIEFFNQMNAKIVQFSEDNFDLAHNNQGEFINELNERVDFGDFVNSNGVTFQVLGPRTAFLLEGIIRFDFVNNIEDIENGAFNFNRVQRNIDRLFLNVVLDAAATPGNNLTELLENAENNVVAQTARSNDAQVLSPISAVLFAEQTSPISAKLYCVFDDQCLGNRQRLRFGATVDRTCDVVGDGSNRFLCNDFVSFFTLRWLFAWIGLTYGILALWALYWIYPWARGKCCGGRTAARARAGNNKPKYTAEQTIIINTLATQCASAENLLFQATDFLKQARHLQTILSVEAKRESRIMILTCEYFQASCAILVSLTHAYLDRKTFTAGETWNVEDPAVRALQLEVLNYVRDRLQLAFQSDALSEKSLLRIAEAYAVLKKITDSLVLVGFSSDKDAENSLGNLKTPFVELSENAFYLAGIYRAMTNVPGADTHNGKKVCVIIENADPRDATPMTASAYLANKQKDSKEYDAPMQTVKPGVVGKALSYSSINSGQTGEGLQFFVRTFWGPEIAAIQQEAGTWLSKEGALEAYLERERIEREQKAAPVVKRGPKKKRKKNKKKKNKGYADVDETATEVTDYTEASGWSVESTNDYVYNVSSIVNQGLGIAGKSGMPYDRPGEKPIKKGSKFYQNFEYYMPNVAEWPKFYFLFFVLIPVIIVIPWFAKIGQGSAAYDLDGNVNFKARPAGFGTSFLGVPAYYFLDGFVPANNQFVPIGNLINDAENDEELVGNLTIVNNQLNILNTGVDAAIGDVAGVEDNSFFINDLTTLQFFALFNGGNNKRPDDGVVQINAGVLAQEDGDGVDTIRNTQLALEFTTALLYGLMHNAGYFFGMVPLTLVRESLEIIARRFPLLRSIYPMSLWRELHMAFGLAGIYYVVFGATVFLIAQLVAIGRSTPFTGDGGDPNINDFFNFVDNVLYIRQVLLPAVPLLLLMKYAARGPPRFIQRYFPTWFTKNYWEICYGLHYVVALTAIITLVIYRAQVFYWMGATWGFVWGGNKIVRILRTRKTTIKQTNLVSYTVSNTKDNSKKRSDVLRITLNVPPSFPSSSRGQACWLTVPAIDLVAHPFTLAKVPTPQEKEIMFHIAVRYLPGDDVLAMKRPDTSSAQKPVAAPAPPANPNELPPGWKSAIDDQTGQTYYYNSLEQRTTWTRPKITAADRFFDGVRGITTRMSANLLRVGSARFGTAGLNTGNLGEGTAKVFNVSARATWTQRLANLGSRLSTMDADLRRNAVKNFPVYVSAPLGTSMDDCLLPSLPGSIIITTQNGLPAAESSVRWLLKQGKNKRPKFHFFVSVSREVNDALSVVETLRDAMCEAVVAGFLDIDGLSGRHAHMVDWLGIYIHLTRRKPATIENDRDMLMRSLNPPSAPVTPKQLELINDFIKNRVNPGRLPFDRFLARTQQMVLKRTGMDNLAVGYCGSAKVAYSLRSACRALPRVKFDGEFI